MLETMESPKFPPRYASLELAWHVHFERLKQQPAGCETVVSQTDVEGFVG